MENELVKTKEKDKRIKQIMLFCKEKLEELDKPKKIDRNPLMLQRHMSGYT